jgi:hypothetical protein
MELTADRRLPRCYRSNHADTSDVLQIRLDGKGPTPIASRHGVNVLGSHKV